MAMEIKYWAATDVGRKRAHNEDNFLVDKALNLFLVADGMGGHASGEVASAMAVHTIRDVLFSERDLIERFDEDDPASHIEISTLLEFAVHSACASIYRKAQQEPEKRGMGTTVVCLLVVGRRGFIAYVGDSRIYLLRNGVVYPLTEDHSLMNELIRSGKVAAEEFAGSPYASFKNAMTRAVGVHEHVEVDILDFEVLAGDAFLLCSDGLYEYLEGAEIASNLALSDIEAIPGRFIDLANSRGGKDNITALVVQLPRATDQPGRAAELNFTIDTLRRLPLMRQLSYQQLCKVMAIAKMRPFERGELIGREGEAGGQLCAVLEGDVRLGRAGRECAIIHAGQHFGESDLIDTGTRYHTASGASDGRLLVVDRRDFYEILHRDPQLAVRLLWNLTHDLSKRLHETTDALLRARSGDEAPREVSSASIEIVDAGEIDVGENTVVKRRDDDKKPDDIEEIEVSDLVEV